MKSKKLIILLFLFFNPLLKSFANVQIPDKLIYNGDTLLINTNPLEQLYNYKSLIPKLFGNKQACSSTSCWKGYQAEWTILNEQLYLTGIFSCCFSKDSLKADLKMLFGNKLIDGKVKADWVNSSIIVPIGKLSNYEGYGFVYEKELELLFDRGTLIGSITYDNSKNGQSVYRQNREQLPEFIYKNVNWSNLPDFDDKVIRVYVQFSANEFGDVDSAKVVKGYNEIFDKEAVRVIKAIRKWDVFYRNGKLVRSTWTVPIIFSKANKEKYNK